MTLQFVLVVLLAIACLVAGFIAGAKHATKFFALLVTQGYLERTAKYKDAVAQAKASKNVSELHS